MTVKNLEASVQARLQNHARATKRPFQELLQYYAMERFLYRLSKTPHRARFVLKGALMLHVWGAPLARATKDLDFLGRLDNSLENLERVVREVCAADVEPDGVVFDPTTVKTERIKEDADYEGVRVRFVGLLGRARVAMQIDVGFGDVVTPGAETITYPALLGFPAPELSGYPRETVVAEKFQAMVYLRTLNSRMKDFYDVWLLANQFTFDGALLAKAVAATFANRETAIDVAPIDVAQCEPTDVRGGIGPRRRAARWRLGVMCVPRTGCRISMPPQTTNVSLLCPDHTYILELAQRSSQLVTRNA